MVPQDRSDAAAKQPAGTIRHVEERAGMALLHMALMGVA